MDYFEIFSPVARLNSIRILFSIVINLLWPLFQLDIKNAFSYGDLKEEVQPPGMLLRRRINLSSQDGNIWAQTESICMI